MEQGDVRGKRLAALAQAANCMMPMPPALQISGAAVGLRKVSEWALIWAVAPTSKADCRRCVITQSYGGIREIFHRWLLS
jgi:hypothetical protein